MEEAIYIPVHVPVLHLDFGRNEKERKTKAINDGGVGGRSLVIP